MKTKKKKIEPYGAYQIPGPIIFDIHNSFTKEVYDALFDDDAIVALCNQEGNKITEKLSKKVQKRR